MRFTNKPLKGPAVEGDINPGWIRQEVHSHIYYYIYMTVTTPLIFWFLTDDLTGLYNHRHILEEISKELARAKRYGRILSGMMIDIDNFKEVNDFYGHLEGDSVIKEISAILKQDIRKVDILGRYGGDEFLIILPETSVPLAKKIAERIQQDVRQYRFKTLRDYLSLTVSIGLLCFEDTKDFDKVVFIQKIDQAMFRAKSLGKDRIYTG